MTVMRKRDESEASRSDQRSKSTYNSSEIKKRRWWAWLGHILRMDYDRNPRRAVELDMLSDTPGSLTNHLAEGVRNITDAVRLASDRGKWKKMFEENSTSFVSLTMQCPLLG